MNHGKLARLMGVALVLTLTVSASWAGAPKGKVTFTKDVLPILQDNCQACHRPNGANLGGMVAPMPFMSYQEVRPWVKAIVKKVVSKEMPPWDASPDFHGVFVNERVLTETQIDTIVKWAKSGAPRGNPGDAPEPLQFPDTDGWLIGEPDLIVEMPEPYFVKDDVEDIYVSFYTELTSDMLPEDRYVKAVEFRPGSSVVHHIISDPLGGIAPGNDPTVYRDGFGQLIRKGTTVSFEMHYHKEPGPGTGAWDQSKVAVKFYPKGERPTHEIHIAPLGRFDFRIPAGDPNYTAKVEERFDDDVLILSYTPHMHLRGKSAVYVAEYPDGRIEKLLDVPQYDFNWQTTYDYREPKRLPAGSRVRLAMSWDNSANNPYNPDPTETVTFGEPTTAEMMFGFMRYSYAEEPEAIVLDPAVLKSYAGTYRVGQNFTFVIESKDTYLTAQMGDRAGMPLTTVAENKFTLGLANMQFTFVKDDDGNINGVRIKRDQMNMRAQKIE